MPYATDLTDAQWGLVVPFIPPAKLYPSAEGRGGGA